MTNCNGAPGQGHGLDGFYTALRRPGIVRHGNGRWFAGVASGLARWLGVDPLVVRAAFILCSIFFGMGVALYLVLWLLMPDERGEIHVERALKHGEGGSIVLLVVTAISVLGGGPWWGGDSRGFRVFGFMLLVGGAWWFATRTAAGRDLMAQAPWRNGGGTSGSTSGSAPGTSSSGVGTADPVTPPTAHGSTGNAAANAGMTLATHRPPAPAPVRERTPTIGFAGGLLVLGLAIVTGVVMATVASTAGWAGNSVAIGIACAVGMLGLGILIAGIAGRRSGGLAFFAVTGMAAAAIVTAAPAGLSQPWSMGDQSHQVTSLTPAPDFQLGVGEMRVDLTGADYATTPGTDHVTASIGLGQLDLVVPKGVRVTVNTKARVGALHATGSIDGPVNVESGSDGGGASWQQVVRFGPQTGQEEIVVDAEVGVGEIRIETGAAA